MTREEQIRDAIDTIIPIFSSNNGRTYEQALMASGFEAGVKWADTHPKSTWISVKEDLPCNHEEFIETGGHYLKETIYVITVNKYGIIENNYMILYDDGKWKWKYGATPCYWMLIPKLPKEIEIELATK